MAQPDPSHSVPQDLMSHVHLISSFRYPTMPRLDLSEVAKWLMSAPQVARDRAPFFWTYLDKPADGTILLTWQPLQRLGTNFATDGFVWAPPEQVYKQDLGNGLMLEIYYLKAGYIPGEQYALHARRRFRLVPVPGHPNPPQPDMSLFIVHYGPSDPNERIPAAMVPYDERVNAIMQQRHYLLRAGQIRRKEFMLSDRVNWPSLPELTRQQMGPQMVPRGVPQQMAYPPQPVPGPSAKRARHGPNQGSQQGMMPGMPAMDPTFDDDEDITRGDMFDHLTQREISLSRYQQNHEWMEEILSSAYRINQITPADLNLGLKGELASLTEGIFTAQGAEVFTQAPDRPYIGRLDPGLADEFRKRVSEHTESTLAEIKSIQAAHDEAMAKFKESSLFTTKEAELRVIAKEPTPDLPQAEGQAESPDEESKVRQVPTKTEEEVVKEVEEAVGRKIEGQPLVKRIQQGGYQPPAPAALAHMSQQPSRAASQASGLIMGESDIDMGGTAAGLLDQMHTGFSSMSTPINNFPMSAAQSNAATPSNAQNAQSPAPAPGSMPAPHGGDVSMGGNEAPAKNQEEKGTTPDQGTGSGDWVVVPKGGEAPDAPAGQSHLGVPGAAAASAGEAPKPAGAAAGKPSSAAATPAVTDGGSATFDQNDFSSLGDLDTAGDALAGFDAPDLDGAAGELGDGLDLQMDMEDSAFGDAFHGVDSTGTPGEGQNQDM
ncbi:SWI/SNF and RSC complex subunit Ssr4 [Hirsutella rhossiliensis]|uniref:SWI/SNF and RSC complex subunit Ssr4 n=1 Tax=Hirsutella rhossiliensis TaxID=111463 RepID=A0A9P8N696_9HYPO|nr:SWI/SNF and RSC complex subunit Ssr4 [Hirsutella rhossiliensis]KAH0967342.1 SWI/SNF and RSC complex subunit Ssr4 [Hirsutella rhossiliensis]